MENIESSVSPTGWLTRLWNLGRGRTTYEPTDQKLKALAAQVLQESSTAGISPQQHLLESIHSVRKQISLFEIQENTDNSSRRVIEIGVRELGPKRYSELQETIVNYLALCEAEIGRLFQEKNFDSAVSILEALAPIVPDPTYIHMRIARAHELQHDHARAVTEYEAIATSLYGRATDRQAQAACWAAVGRNALALGDCQKAYFGFLSAVTADYTCTSYHTELIPLLLRPDLFNERGVEPLILYVNTLLDAIKSEAIVFPEDLVNFLVKSLQAKYEETGISEFQGIATRMLRRAGDILIHQNKPQLALVVANLSMSVIRFPSSHPLFDMEKGIAERSSLHPLPGLGAFFSNLGTSEMKGGIIRAVNCTVDGQKTLFFTLKLTHVSRDNVQKWVELFEHNPMPGITVSTVPYMYRERRSDGTFSNRPDLGYICGMAKRISIQNLGSLTLGADPLYGAMYNRLEVEIPGGHPPGQGLHILHMLFSSIGLPTALTEQSPQDDRKIQLFQIFHTFFPKQAFLLERNQAWVEMTAETLLGTMIAQVPESIPLFHHYLDGGRMEKKEILPGCSIWHITDLADRLRSANAWGFMSGIGLPGGSFGEATDRAILMLQNGALSTQCRYDAGVITPGASAKEDHMKGGADCVFTRLITSNLASMPIQYIPFSGSIQVLYDLSLINRGGYAYPEDQYGIRNPADRDGDTYRFRDSLVQTAQQVDRERHESNEFLLKFGIMPSSIVGLVVGSEDDKRALIAKLQEKGLVIDRDGRLYIKTRDIDRPVDEFIHVGDKFTRQMWEHN